jgi:hypothetical protein
MPAKIPGGTVHRNSNTNGRWIVDRLIAIKGLERELKETLSSGNDACRACLRTRVQQLNASIESLDRALDEDRATARAITKRSNVIPIRNVSHNRHSLSVA